MFGLSQAKGSGPRGPKGQRAYVVGDVHGRLDLLERLIERIHDDIDQRGPSKNLVVFLGDLIDRGPSSAQVVEFLRTYRRSGVSPVFLLGNHEEVVLRILGGETELISGWLRYGGAECLESYGADPLLIRTADGQTALRTIRNAIPQSHVDFFRSFVDTCRFGDYLFVHAGIRPGVVLEQQRQSDLRWIREPFLLDETDHGFVVVHGHTISATVDERRNRIGIDTGAYRSDVLTALLIEGERRVYLDTANAVGTAVSATH
ncbi:MAG TPA: metallophosphoesterase family protein [Sphingomicrobium sp.]|nr:metallophosphoesterase family protein [Sphingomicrobium sp.]